MHIPENYLSPSTCAVLGAAMLPVWLMAVKKVRQEVPPEKMPLLGIGAALSFLSMMFNIPLPGGTTGHAVGGTLLAVLFGPWSACLAVSLALFVQALFFGDGGILAFGANCFNMAFAMPFAGYAIYKGVLRAFPQRQLLAAGLGSYVGINLAAFFAAIEFGIQPLLFMDGAGHALYAPYPLWVSIPAMMIGHLTIFGLAEVIFTTAVLGYLQKAAPQLAQGKAEKASPAVYGLLALLICGTPLGLLATGTAWGEWDAEELAEQDYLGSALGYVPSGMEDGFSFAALFPDYAIEGMPEIFGYILSAVIGTALLVLLFKLVASFIGHKTNYDAPAHES
ncbi:cobalt/nickel transport system permease protein [Selenomonas ruminantium]|uniref:Cobalt/nickel transport system permease protein n=1 Tax=Selenomonas ruminantium TaxID=971 RepID=A0A1M6UBA2_SELRU|nr:cobalt transporter CbiM [Selenomonas ruminantium]SHK66457.1 cobalt/nickel transport system permease protein [Selenomonas ruminantium]